jgi:hypothetical protein
MRIEIHAMCRDAGGKIKPVVISTSTKLTIPQLRRLRRCPHVSTGKGVVILTVTGRTDATERVVQVLRTIRFADATGLTPSDAGNKTWNLRHNHRIKAADLAFDHDLAWRTPSGEIVYTNEPYGIDGFAQWAAHTRWRYVQLPPEQSIYGHGAHLFITTADGTVDLDAIANAWVATHD